MRNILFAGVALLGLCGTAHPQAYAVTEEHIKQQQAAHAAHMPTCSAKFVDQWNNWNGDKGAFAMPKTPCLYDQGGFVSIQVCGPKGCGAMPYVLENKDIDEQILVVLHIFPPCPAKFISAWTKHRAKAADLPAKTCVMPGRADEFYVCSKSEQGCTAMMVWIDANSHGNREVIKP